MSRELTVHERSVCSVVHDIVTGLPDATVLRHLNSFGYRVETLETYDWDDENGGVSNARVFVYRAGILLAEAEAGTVEKARRLALIALLTLDGVG